MKAKFLLLLAAILCAWSADAVVGSQVAPDSEMLWLGLLLALPLMVAARRASPKVEPRLRRSFVALSLVLATAATLHHVFIAPALFLVAAALLDLGGWVGAFLWARALRNVACGFVFALGGLRVAELLEVAHLGEGLFLVPLGWLFSWVGQDFSWVGSALSVDLESQSTLIRGDFYKAGLSQVFAFSAAFVAMAEALGWRQTLLRRGGELLLVILAYCFLRTGIVVLLTLSLGQDLRLFLAPIWARGWLLMVLPLALLTYSSAPIARAMPWRKSWSRTAIGLGLGCLIFSWWPQALGPVQAAPVVLDESHSDWERSDSSFNEQSWGRAATYAYGSLGALLEDRGPFRRHLQGELTAADLKDCSVLIIKTPNRPYRAAEITAIETFVHSGGGLLLIGDHTNLFGMAVHLNAIAERFGLSFEHDAAYEAVTGATTFVEEVWSPHPVAAGSAGMAFQTSCTIRPLRPFVQEVFVGRRLAAEAADYSNPNFFGNMRAECADRLGTFLVAAAVDAGAGRVLAFSDSTIFSNFSLYDEGVSEFVRASVGWLERNPNAIDSWTWILPWLATLFLILGLLGLPIDWGQQPVMASLGLLLLALGNFGATELARRANRELLGPQELDVVAFVADASTEIRTSFIDDALALGAAKTGDGVYGNFFISVQRLGAARPERHSDLFSALAAQVEMVVLNQPSRQPSSDELRALSQYVADGGHLLVLDDPSRAASSSANQWLSYFGLSFSWERSDLQLHGATWPGELNAVAHEPSLAGLALGQVVLQRSQAKPSDEMLATVAKTHYVVKGGDALLIDARSRVLAAQGRRGKGMVTAHARASMLDDQALGSRATSIASTEQRARGRAAVELLRRSLRVAATETLATRNSRSRESNHETR